jgi:hypothetical protein
MRIPVLFVWAIKALNGEQELHPRAVAGRRLVTSPDGSKDLIPFIPYWVQLRNTAHMIQHARAMKAGGPAPALPSEGIYREAQEEFVHAFRDLVEKWRGSDLNLAVCYQKHPDVRLKVEKLIRRQPSALLVGSKGPPILINPFALSGLFGLRRNRRGKDNPVVYAREEAITLFIRLVQHPDGSRIGKCLRCGRYFFGRPDQKCCPRPRRCGSYLAAIRATKASWHETRKGLIARAQDAIRRWELDGVRTPWKPWVARRVRKTEKWVTRAVNRGDLIPPAVATESDDIRPLPKKEKANAN